MRKVITATEGHILTNGEIYGRTIYLASDVDPSGFYEITEEEYAKIMDEPSEDDATEEDYQSALAEFGVVT